MNNIKIVRRFAKGQYEEGTEPEVERACKRFKHYKRNVKL